MDFSSESTHERLMHRILVLNERVWEGRITAHRINRWLDNFVGRVADPSVERLHALYWLANFMYFGSREIRVLLRSMYRDLFLRPLIQQVRTRIGRDKDEQTLGAEVDAELARTRFFGVGNPSESGVHLLYYFRQENALPKTAFMDAVQIFARGKGGERTLRKPDVRRYVFLDDICGSGDTAETYSEEVIRDVWDIDKDVEVAYLSLFATQHGLEHVRTETRFANQASAVYVLDRTYRCLDADSRYFGNGAYPDIDKDVACRMVREYGDLLDAAFATGWKDSQMLMGFHHNTPDNTIGIIWHDGAWGENPWEPIFKRYPKIYGQQP